MSMSRPAVLLGIVLVIGMPCVAALAGPSGPSDGARRPPDSTGPQATSPAADQVDVRDVIRKLRHKEQTREEEAAYLDWHRGMISAAPFFASKPSTGLVVGAAGNIAFFRGDPSTTHISSATGGVTFSSRGQVLLNAKLVVFGRDDRVLVVGDNRANWTNEDTYGLGTSAPAPGVLNVKYDFARVYETVYHRVVPALFAGVGLHVSVHTNTGPGEGAEAAWQTSPYVAYSSERDLPLDTQTSAGASVNLLVDTRDSAINPTRGVYANASFRRFFKDFLGGDSAWRELYLDARSYYHRAPTSRHTVAFWFRGDLVTGGTAPYFDLPATGMDTAGRSGRGYAEGRFRGERLLYGEVEYRVTLTANGLIGAVAFLNTTTVTNLQTGERLFDSFATGGGAGVRLLLDKRSRTNLCVDFGWGKEGSRGVYMGIQEAF